MHVGFSASCFWFAYAFCLFNYLFLPLHLIHAFFFRSYATHFFLFLRFYKYILVFFKLHYNLASKL